MPPKKNEDMIAKFKATNQMRKSFGINTSGAVDFKAKVRKAVQNIIDKFQDYINNIIKSLDDVDKRLQAIEVIFFEPDPDDEIIE